VSNTNGGRTRRTRFSGPCRRLKRWSMADDRTIAERRFDELVAARRVQGRKTYGRGLDHNDEFCWKMMALEEALDMGQYLMAHIVRLETEIAGRA
jgi:hypothetical protein